MSSGEFVAFLDADDIFFREKISEQVKIFLKDPSVGLSYSGLIHFTGETNKKFFIHRYNDYRPHDIFLDLFYRLEVLTIVFVFLAVFLAGCFFLAGTSSLPGSPSSL